jgi:YD repeat-containing protein
LTKSVDEEERVTIYEIDANNGDIKSITQVGNTTTPSSTNRFTYENNSYGLVSTITDADGNISANNYDDKGRLIGVKQGNTIVSTLTYDPLSGNILTKTDGNNKKTSYEYKCPRITLSEAITSDRGSISI